MTVDGESLRDGSGRVRPGWATAFASAVGLAFGPSVLQYMTLGVFTPYLRRDFAWSLSQISLAATLLAIMTMIASPLQGLLVDRFGARRIILTSLPLFGLGYAALSLMTGSLSQFYVIWALLPLLGLGLWPASWVKATSSWFERRLGLAIGIATTGIGIGAMVFPVVIHALAEAVGWRSAFAAIGLASILVAWPTSFLFVRDGVVKAAATIADGRHDAPARRSTFWLLLGAFALLGAYSVAILIHLVTILEGNGVARPTAIVAQSALGGFMILGRLGSGYIVDRIAVRFVVPAFAVAAVLALAGLAAGATGAGAILAAAFAGLLIGAEIDVLGFVVKRYFGLRRYGTLYGILFAVFQLGGAIGVLALARMREASGSYMGGLVGLAIACSGAAILFALLGPYRFGQAPQLMAGGAPPGPDEAA